MGVVRCGRWLRPIRIQPIIRTFRAVRYSAVLGCGGLLCCLSLQSRLGGYFSGGARYFCQRGLVRI